MRRAARHRLRRPPDGAGHQGAAALSRRPLARFGGGARHPLARDRSAIRPTRRSRRGRTGAARAASPQPASPTCAARCSSASAPTLAILNCLYGVQLVFNEDMAAAFARALNDWIATRMARPRRRACAPRSWCRCRTSSTRSTRSSAALPIGASCRSWCSPWARCRSGAGSLWPVYAAAERHGLPIGIHAGSAYRHPVTSLGWPSYYIEDYAAQSQAFQSQVASLITEGVFAKYPGAQGGADRIGRDLAARLPVAVLEVLARPAHRGAVGRPLAGRDRARPLPPHHPAARCAADPDAVERAIDHLRSDDMLLYASDFPHWQFDGDDALPPGIPAGLRRKILVDNPIATYNRLT